MSPLSAVATLAVHGRAPSELPSWCDVTDHLAGGAAAALDPPPGAAICDLLGPLYELMLADAVRRSAGVHFTSPALASGLVNFAASIRVGERFRTGEVVLDPACGAGAFLVATARHLGAEAGTDGRSTSAGGILSRLVGADLDPDVLVVASAALARWALDEADAPGHDEAVGRARASGLSSDEPTLVCCDALTQPDVLARAIGGAPVGWVVGNPPFLAQLRAGTRHDARRRSSLTERFGAEVGAYTDTAALFLLAATELVADTGVVCLIQPRSVLAARDAAGVRQTVTKRMPLAAAWVGDGGFGAAVEVWAPVLGGFAAAPVGEVPVRGGSTVEMELGMVPVGALSSESWGALVAAAEGLPAVRRTSGTPLGRLGEVVRFSAGFRDEYYAMLELAQEATLTEREGRPEVPAGFAALVSSGLIDPGVCRWGGKSMRFGKRRWESPVVDLGALAADDAPTTAWAKRQLVPKVLVASQTRVIEAAPDGQGRAIGLTPVIAGVPKGITLGHLLAVLCSPVSTLSLVSAMAGSGMGRAGVRVSTRALGDLDLPVHQGPWDEAAGLLAGRCDLGDGIESATLTWVHELMVAASGIDDPSPVRGWFADLVR